MSMKRTNTRIAAVVLTLGLLLTGCGGTGSDTGNTDGSNVVTPDTPRPTSSVVNLSEKVTKLDIPETPLSESHGSSLSRSGIALLYQTAALEEDKNRNLLISPYSIQAALGMTATGSDDGSATEREMMDILLPGTSEKPEALNREMASFAARMENDPDVSWNVANSIWVNNDGQVKLRDTFISDATNYYDAELFSAPMNEETRASVNAWVKKETRERIPEILSKLDPETVLILINALAFDGEWAEPYEEKSIREKESFTNADGSTSEVTMLDSKEHCFLELGGGLGFIRDYKGYQYSFVGILPPEGMSTEEYLAKLKKDGSDFSEAFLKRDSTRDVYVSLPEFKTEFDICLDKVLQSLGMKEAYSSDASFRKMVSDDSGSVQISTVIHKTMIDVDRAGTKAAAATAVIVTKSAALPDPAEPVSIILNRPFVYAIVDSTTGVPIFLGTQNSMK